MSFHRYMHILSAGGVGLVLILGLTRPSQAALISTGEDITGLDISLAMFSSTDAGAGTTTLQYEVTLVNDPAGVSQIIGFAVIRDWSEGPFHAQSSPAGWSVATTDHFVDWQVFTPGSEIAEGQSLTGFDYTYFGDPPTGQFYRYVVARDGGTPFQVLSDEVLVNPAVVPEPRSAVLLMGAPVAWFLARRRRE